MTIAAGRRLGPYEVVAPLGAGGMGEVYRAHDARLRREVALKILPESVANDRDRMRRFEQEARAAAALNHPNILAVHDIGQQDGVPYIVSELLEGQTLRERLTSGALTARKAIELTTQIAHGLAAAHAKGITHRDLKPENIFVTTDGRVKILDFGLAKLKQPDEAGLVETMAATEKAGTEAGLVLGTVGYMSPEQVRGLPADPRSDIFAFGAILSEMISGQRAFTGPSAVEIMHAILKDDPQNLAPLSAASPALERIVRYCLEKNPSERFQSARDLAIALETLTGSGAGVPSIASPVASRRLTKVLALAIALAVATATGWWTHSLTQSSTGTASPTVPSYHQLTFRRGFIGAARFTPDEETVVYSAAWDGAGSGVYLTRRGNPESRLLVRGAHLASISRSGELAVILNPSSLSSSDYDLFGTLAQVPLTGGGATREIAEQVEYADWSPDGRELAIVRREGEGRRHRLEYPIGTVLIAGERELLAPRVSPDGNRVAFFEWTDDGNLAISVVDRQGKQQQLSTGWIDWWFLAWAPDGREVWFAATEPNGAIRTYAVDLTGRQRLLFGMPGVVELQDVSPKGRLLIKRTNDRRRTVGVPPDSNQEREYVLHDKSAATDVSDDGRTLVFQDIGESGGRSGVVYLQRTDGSPAVRLGEGRNGRLSPDGKWVAAVHGSNQIRMIPTGAGQPQHLSFPSLQSISPFGWFPDGRRFVIAASEKGQGLRLYVRDVGGGEPRAIGPVGLGLELNARPVSPDGKTVAARDSDGNTVLLTVATGETRVLTGGQPGEVAAGWTSDGRSLYVYRRGELPAKVLRVDVETGRRSIWKEIRPYDVSGAGGVMHFLVAADGRSYFYTYRQILSELFLVEGVK